MPQSNPEESSSIRQPLSPMAMHLVPEETMHSTSSPDKCSVSAIIAQYLSENSPPFRDLLDLRAMGWQTPKGDQFFQNLRNKADNANRKQAQGFFVMTRQIGSELEKETSVITHAINASLSPRVLDMGMAPGGFSATVLGISPSVKVRGITLPTHMGGLEVMLPRWKSDNRVSVEFVDVTMLADELGRPTMSIPVTHPDIDNFCSDRPFWNETFDLIFCGAAVQRAHPRASYRETKERLRLVTSQLVVALQHLRRDGSLVLLMHRAEAWDTIKILNAFSKFSSVRLFKSRTKHAVRSCFYMVATKVQPHSEEALSAATEWKTAWERATFQADSGLPTGPLISEDCVREMLAEFGPQLIDLATPVWKIQAHGLRSASFIRGSDGRRDSARTRMR